jgi:hypothetical protein
MLCFAGVFLAYDQGVILPIRQRVKPERSPACYKGQLISE